MKKKNQKGFTMIETILVLLLVGLTAMAVGSTYNADNFSSYSALQKVIGDIRYAQQMALVSGQAYGFRTLTNHSYEIYQGSPGTPATDPLNQAAFTVDLATNYKNSVFASSTYQIEFGAGGAPTLGGAADYTIQAGTTSLSFHVESSTGYLK